MNKRFFLSQFFLDETGRTIPVCAAYSGEWMCPRFPSSPSGYAIVTGYAAPQQVEAAKQDPRVKVLTLSGVIPQEAVDAYHSQGASYGMTLQQLLDKLSEVEPIYGTL